MAGTARRSKVSKPGHRLGRKKETATAQKTSTAAPATDAADNTNVDMQDSSENTRFWNRVVLDYGTKTQSISYRVVSTDSSDATNGDIYEIPFGNAVFTVPQRIGFSYGNDGERKVFVGDEVMPEVNAGRLQAEDTIEMWKLALYNDHADSEMVKRIHAFLDRHDLGIVDLIAIHLEKLLPMIRSKSQSGVIALMHDVKNMDIELWISVPQMWEPPACKKMMLAVEKVAEKTGVKWAKLILEPECAAAFYLHTIKTTLNMGYKVGDEIIVCDIGGGTGDFLRVQYESDPADGAKVVLKNTGTATGALCGSEFVNEAFRVWLKKVVTADGHSFEDMCVKLGYSELECLMKASEGFEREKPKFTIADQLPLVAIVYGAQGSALSWWPVEVPHQTMIDFFSQPLQKIIHCIERQCRPNTKEVVVTGGFGKSDYLIHQLKAYFERDRPERIEIEPAYTGDRSDRAVSVGGQVRWPEIEATNFDAGQNFGIPSEELFNKNRHRDAVKDKRLIVESPYDDVLIVEHRWLTLVNQDTERREGAEFATEKWQLSIVPEGTEILAIPVYYTKLKMRDGAAILNGPNETDGLRQGIELWDTLNVPLPDFKVHGFTAVSLEYNMERSENAAQHVGDVYQFWWRLSLQGKGANVSVKWELAAPGTQPYDAYGKSNGATPILTLPMSHKLCDEDFDPFAKHNY